MDTLSLSLFFSLSLKLTPLKHVKSFLFHLPVTFTENYTLLPTAKKNSKVQYDI